MPQAMVLRGPAIVAALLAASGAAQETDAPAGVCLLQKSPGQTHKTQAHVEKHTQVERSDLEAVGAAYSKVHDLLDRHEKITGLIQQSGRRSGHAIREAHSTVSNALTKLRKSSESLLEVAAAAGSHMAVHAALHQIEAPAKELKEGLDHLEGLYLMQQNPVNHAIVKRGKAGGQVGRQTAAAVSKSFDDVHNQLNRHAMILSLTRRGRHRRGVLKAVDVKKAHNKVGKSISQLKKKTTALLEVAAAAGSHEAVHAALRQIEAPAKELKEGLDHLESVYLPTM